MTTLGALKVGSMVNIEVDIIGKYIEKLLAPRSAMAGSAGSEGINPGFLAQHGFM
jgi:riboflavin synthase